MSQKKHWRPVFNLAAPVDRLDTLPRLSTKSLKTKTTRYVLALQVMGLEPLFIVRLGYGMTVSVTPFFMRSMLTGTSE